ncbi:hypothetical protein ElyMa_000935500 [Elysia marginata]|uniref:Uncharacterized protein n=1 Tax=Elysia marginata TaxID=1093978 RepID=A0AAV4HA72_9GAST|nr:hypothetical protein ElyMa_000935500 [Elysia marginata]
MPQQSSSLLGIDFCGRPSQDSSGVVVHQWHCQFSSLTCSPPLCPPVVCFLTFDCLTDISEPSFVYFVHQTPPYIQFMQDTFIGSFALQTDTQKLPV